MDKISLKRIRLETIIGVLPEERLKAQELFVSVDAESDFSGIQLTDQIADGIDYVQLVKEIRDFATNSKAQTLEYFAHHLALGLKSRFALKRIRLTVDKPLFAPDLDVEAIEVTVER